MASGIGCRHSEVSSRLYLFIDLFQMKFPQQPVCTVPLRGHAIPPGLSVREVLLSGRAHPRKGIQNPPAHSDKGPPVVNSEKDPGLETLED